MTGPRIAQPWDRVEARRLYDAGASLRAIAIAVGADKNVIARYSTNHWPTRESDVEIHREKFRPRSATPPPAKRLKRGQSTLPPLSALDETPPWC